MIKIVVGYVIFLAKSYTLLSNEFQMSLVFCLVGRVRQKEGTHRQAQKIIYCQISYSQVHNCEHTKVSVQSVVGKRTQAARFPSFTPIFHPSVSLRIKPQHKRLTLLTFFVAVKYNAYPVTLSSILFFDFKLL